MPQRTASAAGLSGMVNDTVSWTFAGGTLTMSGEGEMDSTLIRDTPWRNDFDQDIINLVIGEGITDIGKVVMVGDRFYDIEGALAVGALPCGVTYGYGTAEELWDAGAKWVEDSAKNLKSLFLQ